MRLSCVLVRLVRIFKGLFGGSIALMDLLKKVSHCSQVGDNIRQFIDRSRVRLKAHLVLTELLLAKVHASVFSLLSVVVQNARRRSASLLPESDSSLFTRDFLLDNFLLEFSL